MVEGESSSLNASPSVTASVSYMCALFGPRPYSAVRFNAGPQTHTHQTHRATHAHHTPEHTPEHTPRARADTTHRTPHTKPHAITLPTSRKIHDTFKHVHHTPRITHTHTPHTPGHAHRPDTHTHTPDTPTRRDSSRRQSDSCGCQQPAPASHQRPRGAFWHRVLCTRLRGPEWLATRNRCEKMPTRRLRCSWMLLGRWAYFFARRKSPLA